MLSTSLVIPLVSITPGPAGKDNSEWEEGKGDRRDRKGRGMEEEEVTGLKLET